MTCSRQDLMFIFYCLRRFCETIVRNGYQWICLVVSKCYLNLSFFFLFHFFRHVPHECYSLPSRVGVGGGGLFFSSQKSIWKFCYFSQLMLFFPLDQLFKLVLIRC